MALDELVGIEVKSIYINSDKNKLYIVDNEDRYHCLECTADCCSETWIEHIIFDSDRLNLSYKTDTIKKVIRITLGSVTGTKQEVDQLYSIIFCLDELPAELPNCLDFSNDIVCEFRNSSNGYYGGDIEYTGVFNTRPDDFDDFHLINEGE